MIFFSITFVIEILNLQQSVHMDVEAYPVWNNSQYIEYLDLCTKEKTGKIKFKKCLKLVKHYIKNVTASSFNSEYPIILEKVKDFYETVKNSLQFFQYFLLNFY